MKRIKLFTAALLLAAMSAGNDMWALSTSGKKDTHPVESPKFFSGNANPLSDFIFVADPTSMEYNGRLYVYGTNDTQQLDSVGKDGKNTYQYIHSLVMLSTDDMVNWTYHGLIDVKALISMGYSLMGFHPLYRRVESDGKTHFYLYYSNSGCGRRRTNLHLSRRPVDRPAGAYAGEPVHPRIRPLQSSLRPGCRDR